MHNYTIGDVLDTLREDAGARACLAHGLRMRSSAAENTAIKDNAPAKSTHDNIAYMKPRPLKSLGFAFDWPREIATCDRLTTAGISGCSCACSRGHRLSQTGVVNWDPVDQTVLANEQVIDGRAGARAPSSRTEIPMYYLGITQYAEELLGDLEKLPDWPAREDDAGQLDRQVQGLRDRVPYRTHTQALMRAHRARSRCFTTRADTLFGALSWPLPRSIRWLGGRRRIPAVQAFIDECRRGSTIEADHRHAEKKGMPTGLTRAASVHRQVRGSMGRRLCAHRLWRRRRHRRAGA